MDGAVDAFFDVLDLQEYETEALRALLTIGSTSAPNLAEATGIPQSRIYGVLDLLADQGYVKEIPGRPKTYRAKPPQEIVECAEANYRHEYERKRTEIEQRRTAFVDEYGPAFERATDDLTPTEELFYVVDVGEPSESETRQLYEEAEREIQVLTKSFEYHDRIATAFGSAIESGIDISVLFLHPSHLEADNATTQRAVVDRLREECPATDIRYSEGILPWRGTIADPSMAYESGRAVMLVEEKDIPLSMRQAAVTENAPFVAGMKRYFDLIWDHESLPVDDVG